MSDWLILVENASDLQQYETPHKVMRIRDYLTNPNLFTGRLSDRRLLRLAPRRGAPAPRRADRAVDGRAAAEIALRARAA
jgi:hypothetical protein